MILCREAECAIRINSFLRTLERPKVSNVRPSALECVQCDNWWNIHIVLSLAYETLSNPSSKFMYDLSKPGQYPIGGVGSPFVRTNGDHPNETLQRVLHQLFMEMMDGEFQTMRAFIRKYIYTSTWYLFFTHSLHTDALNETNPGMHISEDAVIQIELAFRKMRELLLCKFLFL